MNSYTPHHWITIGGVIALLAVEVSGNATRLRHQRGARVLIWLMTAAVTGLIAWLTTAEPPGVRMVAIILALLYGMKALVGVEAGTQLSDGRWLGFCLLWFGMRPGLFARTSPKPFHDTRALFVKGVTRSVMGLALILFAWTIRSNTHWRETIPLLVGLSLLLHFGFFNILAAFWRWRGIDARPLFRAPLQSMSLSEFWSRRWNLAFSEMAALTIYRPVASALGRRAGVLATFAFSGLVHELAISVPVQAGYGGPSLYFLIHALLVQFEDWLERHGMPISARPWLGGAWTLAALALPLPLLFHRPFLAGIVWPLIGIEDN